MKKSNIQTKREFYKPFDYPELYEYYRQSALSTWLGDSIPMAQDVVDFNHNTNAREKEVIQSILRGFTIMETRIGDYWGETITKMFPKYELIAVARAFSFEETNHQMAYSHLSDSLDLNEYEAFLEDPVVAKKLEQFVNCEDPLVSIATFSGVGEGLQLFSSFAVLLSFCQRNNRFTGIDTIVGYSAREESIHSSFGIKLFNILVSESGITQEQTDAIYQAFRLGIENEFNFITQIFNGRTLPSIKEDELKDYMLIRANSKLVEMNLEPIFKINGIGNNIAQWFDVAINGQISHDFFARQREGSTYSSILKQDFNAYDYSTTRLITFS